MQLLLDESGDTGFSFDKPYRNGGSSRYLTIVLFLLPRDIRNIPKRIVRKIYSKKKRPTSKELKGSILKPIDKIWFANKVISMFRKHPEISLLAITVKKINVQEHIKDDPNKLYNYMIKLSLEGQLNDIQKLQFIPDPRSIKVESGNSLIDYLETTCWFDWDLVIEIEKIESVSHNNLNLQFVDFLANIVWSHYEDTDSEAYNLLKPIISEKNLFF